MASNSQNYTYYEQNSDVKSRVAKLLKEGQKIAEDVQKSSEALVKETRSLAAIANNSCDEKTIGPASHQEFPDEQTNCERLIKEVQKYVNLNNQWVKNIQKGVEDMLEEMRRAEPENTYLQKNQESSSFIARVPLLGRLVTKKARVTCQVYCVRDVDNTVTQYGLTELIKTLRNLGEYELEIQFCGSASEIQTALPVVVICFNYSRIGTSVNSALKGIKPGPNVALLILHHKDIHALPTQKTQLTAPEYQGLGAIIDMAFLSDRGIYTCEMNKKAVAELISFINNR